MFPKLQILRKLTSHSRAIHSTAARMAHVPRKFSSRLQSSVDRMGVIVVGDTNIRMYSCSSSVTEAAGEGISAPVSRKKRKKVSADSAESTSASSTSASASTSTDRSLTAPKEWKILAHEAMTMIESALAPLVPLNAGYTLKHSESAGIILDCGEKTGKYTVKVDHKEEKLILQTPISGTLEYFYDPTPDMCIWLNCRDGHDMRGIITRDLLRHATGLAKF